MSDNKTRWLERLTDQERLSTGNPQLALTDTQAAAILAEGLMKGDPATFKQGYTRENAVISASEMFAPIDRNEVDKELTRRQEGA